MNPKISIIIPAYNTEKHIDKCLHSTVNQTLKEIEIIIINDASTDDTLKIIEQYKSKDNRIKLIDFKENKGNGIGRNKGIKKATGKYVLFLDSDDWLEPTIAEETYKLSEFTKSHIVVFGYFEQFQYKNLINQNKEKTKEHIPTLSKNDPHFFSYYLMALKGLYSMPWMYAFSRELLLTNNIFFSEGVYFEDINFVAKAMHYTTNISVIYRPLYNYRIRQNSIIQSTSKKKIDDLYTAYVTLKNFLEKEQLFKKYESEYLIRFLIFCVYYSFLDYFKMDKNKIDTELKEYMNEIRKSKLLRPENLFLIKNTFKKLDPNEKRIIKIYKNAYLFLSNIKHSYTFFKFIFKIIYALNKKFYLLK